MAENIRENSTVKRKGYLEWDEYFMSIAFLSAQRSKDPRTQVGACIVNENRRIVGVGYNGMPRGCSDDIFPWCNEGPTPMDDKNLYVCHAELNAILNSSGDVKNCSIYVGLFPCNECAKAIVQSGIKEVIYYSRKYQDRTTSQAAEWMLKCAEVKCRQFQPKQKQITIDFSLMDQINERIISTFSQIALGE